jgi:hypothetical protein
VNQRPWFETRERVHVYNLIFRAKKQQHYNRHLPWQVHSRKCPRSMRTQSWTIVKVEKKKLLHQEKRDLIWLCSIMDDTRKRRTVNQGAGWGSAMENDPEETSGVVVAGFWLKPLLWLLLKTRVSRSHLGRGREDEGDQRWRLPLLLNWLHGVFAVTGW